MAPTLHPPKTRFSSLGSRCTRPKASGPWPRRFRSSPACRATLPNTSISFRSRGPLPCSTAASRGRTATPSPSGEGRPLGHAASLGVVVQPGEVGAHERGVARREVFAELVHARHPAQQAVVARHLGRAGPVPLEFLGVAPLGGPPQPRAARDQVARGDYPHEGAIGEGHRLGDQQARLSPEFREPPELRGQHLGGAQQRRRAPLPCVALGLVAARRRWAVELQGEPLAPPGRDAQDLREALAQPQRLQGGAALAVAFERRLGQAPLQAPPPQGPFLSGVGGCGFSVHGGQV